MCRRYAPDVDPLCAKGYAKARSSRVRHVRPHGGAARRPGSAPHHRWRAPPPQAAAQSRRDAPRSRRSRRPLRPAAARSGRHRAARRDRPRPRSDGHGSRGRLSGPMPRPARLHCRAAPPGRARGARSSRCSSPAVHSRFRADSSSPWESAAWRWIRPAPSEALRPRWNPWRCFHRTEHRPCRPSPA